MNKVRHLGINYSVSIFLSLFIFLFTISFVSSLEISQWDKIQPSGNITNEYINNTYINQTLELNSTQFETGEPATIKESWLQNRIELFAPTPDLSTYWKNDGTSTATGNWDIGTNSFKSVNVQADTTRVFVGTKSTAGSLTSTDSVYIGEAILGVLNRAISGTKNVGIGYYALQRLSSGGYNTAVGIEAGGSTTGAYSSFLGYRAGLYTLGTANWAAPINGVYIGASTESASAGQTNEIVIGYNADGKGSNTAVLGNDDIVSTFLKGNVTTSRYFKGNYTSSDGSIGWSGNCVNASYKNGLVVGCND